MKFLFIVFLFFVLFVFLFGFSILRMLFGWVFGKPQQRQGGRSSQTGAKQADASSSSKKIIAPDEGEYVDYVEIKD
jgi:hypothetical protein